MGRENWQPMSCAERSLQEGCNPEDITEWTVRSIPQQWTRPSIGGEVNKGRQRLEGKKKRTSVRKRLSDMNGGHTRTLKKVTAH